MALVSVESSTEQPGVPRDLKDGFTAGLVVQPVFTRGGDQRRRVLVGGGLLLAASCVAYVVMVLLSLFASPGARPTPGVAESGGATLVNQVSPQPPLTTAVAPSVTEPDVRFRVRVRVRARAAVRPPVHTSLRPGSRPATASAARANVVPSKPAPTGVASPPKAASMAGAMAGLKTTPSSAAALRASPPSRTITARTMRAAAGGA